MAYAGTLIRSGNNAKTVKGDDKYETAIMYLTMDHLRSARDILKVSDGHGAEVADFLTALSALALSHEPLEGNAE